MLSWMTVTQAPTWRINYNGCSAISSLEGETSWPGTLSGATKAVTKYTAPREFLEHWTKCQNQRVSPETPPAFIQFPAGNTATQHNDSENKFILLIDTALPLRWAELYPSPGSYAGELKSDTSEGHCVCRQNL